MCEVDQRAEILLIDDGSSDGTGALCERLAREDERIRVYHKENGGASSARNMGIGLASGAYLGFVDSDDHIEPDMYELMMNAMHDRPGDVVQISRDEVDDRGRRLPDVCVPPEQVQFCRTGFSAGTAAAQGRLLVLHQAGQTGTV